MSERDPHGIDQHAPGAKLDHGKPLAGILLQFSKALRAVVDVGTFGANKYSRGGWQHVPNGVVRYTDAMLRHILEEPDNPISSDGLLTAAQVAWNALARLELMLRKEQDDEQADEPASYPADKAYYDSLRKRCKAALDRAQPKEKEERS